MLILQDQIQILEKKNCNQRGNISTCRHLVGRKSNESDNDPKIESLNKYTE